MQVGDPDLGLAFHGAGPGAGRSLSSVWLCRSVFNPPFLFSSFPLLQVQAAVHFPG